MKPVDLLLISWNRREYLEKTIPNLLADPADFRLYCWDNASEDGAADIIASLNDPRVVKRHYSKQNVKQREPTLWFFGQAQNDVVGKIDDDILLPHGWTGRIAPIVRNNPKAGMLGCWIFMEEDWDEQLAKHKFVDLNGSKVFQNTWIAGQSFLARLEILKNYILPEGKGYGFPVDQFRMTSDGYINGYPLPILFAHNMDDPRSEYCLMNKTGKILEHSALTARHIGFASPQEYGQWIARDAKNILTESISRQIKVRRIQEDQSFQGKIRRKIFKYFHV